MACIVGIDYGKRRIGLARTAGNGVLAVPWTSLDLGQTSLEQKVDRILSTLQGVKCGCIVVGLPLLLSGKESAMTQEVRQFAELLKTKSGLKVALWDERLSTSQVDRLMKEHGMSRRARTSRSDVLAAMVILQAYLDAHLV